MRSSTQTPTLPVRLNPQVPAELERIIGKALEKKPELRYQSAADMRVDLTRLLRETQTTLGRRPPALLRLASPGQQPACTAQELEGRRRSRRAAGSPGCWRWPLRARADRNPQAPSAPASVQPSIAVLPFADMSAQKDQEYFSDGLAEELLNSLAKIQGLRVVARTSSFQFKGKTEDLRTVGEKLNVSTILEGSVRKQGDTRSASPRSSSRRRMAFLCGATLSRVT